MARCTKRCLAPRMTKKLKEELQRTRENINTKLFMREVIKTIGPFETGKILTRIGDAPNVEQVFEEERQQHALNHNNFHALLQNSKGEFFRFVPKVDYRIVKMDPDEDVVEKSVSPKSIKTINFIDITRLD